MNQVRAAIERARDAASATPDWWGTLRAADAALILDDDTDLLDRWLATMTERDLEAILSYVLA